MTTVEQLILNFHASAEFWAWEQFAATPNEDILKRFLNASTKERYLSVKGEWFLKYVGTELGRVVNCTIVMVEESGGDEMLGRPTVSIEVIDEEGEDLLL